MLLVTCGMLRRTGTARLDECEQCERFAGPDAILEAGLKARPLWWPECEHAPDGVWLGPRPTAWANGSVGRYR